MADVVKVTFHKKIVNPSTGEVTGSVPVVPATLAEQVYMSNGNTVEQAIAGARGYVTYATKAAYMTAYQGGQIPAGTLAIVEE